MAQFLLTYLEQPQMSSPEDGKAHMGKWMDWLAGLGEAVVYPASPVKRSKTLFPTNITDFNNNTSTGATAVFLVHKISSKTTNFYTF